MGGGLFAFTLAIDTTSALGVCFSIKRWDGDSQSAHGRFHSRKAFNTLTVRLAPEYATPLLCIYPILYHAPIYTCFHAPHLYNLTCPSPLLIPNLLNLIRGTTPASTNTLATITAQC